MKKLLKKTLALALAATLVLGAGPLAGLCGLELPSISSFTASAAEEEPVWTVATDDILRIEGNTIVGYTNKLAGNIEIPTHINGTAITTIKSSAFENCTSLTAVKIPEGITVIKPQAFKNCSNLEKVYFNSNNCEIANAIFNDCVKFSKIVFSENVTTIPENVCSQATELTTAVFEGNVTTIEDLAFNNCESLTGVDLSNVTLIGRCAFNNCDSIKTVNFANNLKEIGAEAYRNCDGITSITIPESVTIIRAQAFENCANLEDVYFNSNNPEIINAIFKNCVKFEKIVFGENVIAIPASVCFGAANLKTVEFDGLVTAIGTNAFNSCSSLTDVYYNEGSEEDWNKVEIKSGNDILSSDDVKVHYGVYPVMYESDNSFDVIISCSSKTFSQEVKLSVTETEGERENGSINISDGEIREQIGCFDIKMVLADGSSTAAVQPNGKVTVKMAIPANYIGKMNFKIVHRTSNGQRENFATNPKGSEKKLSVSSDGKYWIFEVTSFSDFEFFAVEAAPTVSIKNNNGAKTINYGDILHLTANTSNIPADAKIFWYVDGVKRGEGTTFEVSPESGSVDVTVKVVDASGNDYADIEISDSQKVTVKSGFFQKLINFFKNLFGISRIISQAFIVK